MSKPILEKIDLKTEYPLVSQFLKLAKMEQIVCEDTRDHSYKEGLVLKETPYVGDSDIRFWKNMDKSLKSFLKKNTK